MTDLENLILCISDEFENINEKWKQSKYYKKINMSKKLVNNFYEDPSLLQFALIYRSFVLDLLENSSILFFDLKLSNKVFSRIKTINSIHYKIVNYHNNHNNGKIPINKCLNDLVGIRIILETDLTLGQVEEWVKENFPELKVIFSIKKEYRAIHIYFGKGDNYIFQWELQIWLKKDSNRNLLSHQEYKQEYVKWEERCEYV